MADEGPFITKTGRVLTDADFERLADESERGYDFASKPFLITYNGERYVSEAVIQEILGLPPPSFDAESLLARLDRIEGMLRRAVCG